MFDETPEHRALRGAVAELAARYGFGYAVRKAHAGERLDELWHEAGQLGYLGVNLPQQYGGGGGGIYELALVQEEFSAAGCGLLLMTVSPAICGTVIARFGTAAQRESWLPGLADGSTIMAFALTEPDAGSNTHRLATTARPDGDDWVLSGRKCYISGLDAAAAILVVARIGADTGTLAPALFLVPTDAPRVEFQPISMDIVAPERQYLLFLDEVRLGPDSLVGAPDVGAAGLFAGLNPERILTAAFAVGLGRFALSRAAGYLRERTVWDQPLGTHQGLAHPLAQAKIEVELARLMMQQAALRYDQRDEVGAGEAANMAKYSAAEACVHAVDQAVQCLGGNGLASEYGLGRLIATSRALRIAPVSREMILNYVAQHSLGLPRSY